LPFSPIAKARFDLFLKVTQPPNFNPFPRRSLTYLLQNPQHDKDRDFLFLPTYD
jgi:hypothetical protein